MAIPQRDPFWGGPTYGIIPVKNAGATRQQQKAPWPAAASWQDWLSGHNAISSRSQQLVVNARQRMGITPNYRGSLVSIALKNFLALQCKMLSSISGPISARFRTSLLAAGRFGNPAVGSSCGPAPAAHWTAVWRVLPVPLSIG